MKTIVITGTRKGIGKEMAKHYLAEGWQVVGCSRGEGSIEHDHYQHFSLDVSDEDAVIAMARTIKASHGEGRGASKQRRHRINEPCATHARQHGEPHFAD